MDQMTLGDDAMYPTYVGLISAVVAVLFFGSNFIPVKKFETGDGMFFQWVLCWAIWITGLCVHLFILDNTYNHFYPLAMLGGFIWATGNICVVPIIKTIGMGQGILIWGTSNMLIGWLSGRFGWFGLDAQVPTKPTLNYIGVVLCVISGVINVFIKTVSQTRVDEGNNETAAHVNGLDDQDQLINASSVDESHISLGQTQQYDANTTFLEKLSPIQKRLLGITLSVISGLAYGLNFTPVIYIQNNYPGASQNGLDYVFAHFSGILLTSSAYFLVYCAFMRNRPRVYPRAILPGFLSGVMWAVADAGWFVANSVLSEAISFPIVTTGPALVAALWGIFFGEIRGRRNLLILSVAFCFTISGGVVTGFSK